MIFQHRFFEDLAAMAGLPGMPDFLRREDVADAYRSLSGHQVVDLDFYILYAALRHAVIMFRVQSRAVAFGQAEFPDNPDEMILHHKDTRSHARRHLLGVARNIPAHNRRCTMTLSPLDDYPVHQIAETIRHVGTSDRNFYDRYYFNCHAGVDGDTEPLFLIIGSRSVPPILVYATALRFFGAAMTT